MHTTTTLFLRSDPAMYTSPGRTYARVGVRDPARMYVRGRIFFLAHWPLYVRVHAKCAPLLRHVRTSTSTSIYVRTCSRLEGQRYVRFDQVGPDCQALPCVQRCSWWVPAVRGKRFFREIRWPVQWVPAVRWRNNYFARNKEALPCCGRGPSCQPLHVQSTSDGSRSLTTLTTPRREHQGGGRRRGLGRG